MFLAEKTRLTSHFKSISKKSLPNPDVYQLAARNFDEKVIFHLKTLTPATDSTTVSLSWIWNAVSFLSIVHFEAQDQISNFKSESDYSLALYMDYSLKVLDLCNLISSAVDQLTERRLLMNLSLRLVNVNSSGQIPSSEKLKKAKDALVRSVHKTHDVTNEKGQRAKALIEELASAISSLPIGKTTSARDLIRRTLHSLGVLTVFVAGVLVSVLYRHPDPVDFRVPADFVWADLVNGVQRQIFNLIKPKQDGEKNGWLLELEDTASRALVVCDVLDEVVGGGGDEQLDRLEDGVKELRNAAAIFSNVLDELTSGVRSLFDGVLETRNGVLDGVRKSGW